MCIVQVFKRALVILPYISIVAERTCSLQRTLQPVAGGKVQGYFSSGENGTPLSPWWVPCYLLSSKPADTPWLSKPHA